ncbi:MAG TPA: 50S ribosomal protein L15 [Candidatus Paceibacterota bacterium]
MQFHELKSRLKPKKPRRIGRGGKRGSYSGRGIKGQKSRSGRRIRPQLRDVLKKLPKKRGYGAARISKKIAVVNLEDLERSFEKNSTVSPSSLFEKGLIRKIGGKIPAVKILGKGTLSKPLTLKGFSFSKSARAAIEKAGGTIVS